MILTQIWVVVTGASGPGLRQLSYKYNPTIFADPATTNVLTTKVLVVAGSAKMVGLYL